MNILMKRPAASGVEPVPSKRSMKHGKSISEQVLSRSQKVPPASPNGNSVLCGGCARVRVQRRSADSVDSLGLLPLYQVSRKFLCENCHSAATALTEFAKLPWHSTTNVSSSAMPSAQTLGGTGPHPRERTTAAHCPLCP